MHIESFDEDLTPAEIATRMLGKSKNTSDLIERVLAANPQLAGLKTIPKRTPIVIPADPSPDPRLAAAVDRAQRAIDDTAKHQHESLAGQRASLDDRMELIKQIRPLLPADATIVRKVDEIQASSKQILVDLAVRERDVDIHHDELTRLAAEAVPKALPIPLRK